jgi:RES domain-containing protein
MLVYRIADRRHLVWDGTGAMLIGGRWNSPGKAVIYGSASFAGAMLEAFVHARTGKLPRHHVYVVATVPDNIQIRRVGIDQLPADWHMAESQSARDIGDQWLAEAACAVMMVPSVVAREEWNVVVNPLHPDAAAITVSEAKPVVWDERLFKPDL